MMRDSFPFSVLNGFPRSRVRRTHSLEHPTISNSDLPETPLSFCQLEMLTDHMASTSLGKCPTNVSGPETKANEYAPGPLIP
jgi:hypothetical protein